MSCDMALQGALARRSDEVAFQEIHQLHLTRARQRIAAWHDDYKLILAKSETFDGSGERSLRGNPDIRGPRRYGLRYVHALAFLDLDAD
jgi:hypothetical protein